MVTYFANFYFWYVDIISDILNEEQFSKSTLHLPRTKREVDDGGESFHSNVASINFNGRRDCFRQKTIRQLPEG